MTIAELITLLRRAESYIADNLQDCTRDEEPEAFALLDAISSAIAAE